MLKAETREDIEAVKKIALEGNFCVVYEDGLAINGFITFDQMQQIVKHLRLAKDSRYWKSLAENNNSNEQSDFDKIDRLKRVGIYSKVNALLWKVRSHNPNCKNCNKNKRHGN